MTRLQPLALFLCAMFLTVMPLHAQIAPKKKLAVLKITYTEFTPAEQGRVNAAFYESLARNGPLEIITEARARELLLPSGLAPEELQSEADYLAAGRSLQVDYVLVGAMEKVGDFVEVTFRAFTLPRGAQKEYPGGKTMDLFVQQEIPKMVALIQNDLAPPLLPAETTAARTKPDTLRAPITKSSQRQPAIPPEKKSAKRRKLPWLALGGVAVGGGIAAAVLLGSGGEEEKPAPRVLARPPRVP